MADDHVSITTHRPVVDGYLALPEGKTKGGLIVIHEVWGLNEHTKDVARRFADQGYVTLAPDLISGTAAEGLTPDIMQHAQNPVTRDEAQKEMRAKMGPLQSPEFSKATLEKICACFDWLEERDDVASKIGVVGFCFGGTYAFTLATAEPRLTAAVAFYGHSDHSIEQLQNIACPVLAFYGDQDTNLTDKLPELTQNMKTAGRDFTSKVYPDTGHAFFNDTNPNRYNQAAATDAWQRTFDFLEPIFQV